MTPPAHLLPLALEAMTSPDACEVLEDAIQESGWSDWTRVARLLWFDGEVRKWEDYVAERTCFPGRIITRTTARAIAAVLLFGSWSEERWPLVEAHEARRRACITPSYLVDRDELARMYTPAAPSGPFLVGIDRAGPPTRLAGVQVIADPNCPEGVAYLVPDGWTLRASDIAPEGQLLHIQQRDEEDDDADLG